MYESIFFAKTDKKFWKKREIMADEIETKKKKTEETSSVFYYIIFFDIYKFYFLFLKVSGIAQP